MKNTFSFCKLISCWLFPSKEKRLNVSFSFKTEKYEKFFLQKENEKFSYLILLLFLGGGKGRNSHLLYTLVSLHTQISAYFNSFSGKVLYSFGRMWGSHCLAILIARQKELKWYFIIFLCFLLCRQHKHIHTRWSESGTIIISNLISFWFAPLRLAARFRNLYVNKALRWKGNLYFFNWLLNI